MSLSPAQLGQLETLIASIPPGTVHLVLTTPLGTAIVDPFAPDAGAVKAMLDQIGVGLTVRMGPPTAEELAQPSLASNLSTLGLVLGGLALFWIVGRRR